MSCFSRGGCACIDLASGPVSVDCLAMTQLFMYLVPSQQCWLQSCAVDQTDLFGGGACKIHSIARYRVDSTRPAAASPCQGPLLSPLTLSASPSAPDCAGLSSCPSAHQEEHRNAGAWSDYVIPVKRPTRQPGKIKCVVSYLTVPWLATTPYSRQHSILEILLDEMQEVVILCVVPQSCCLGNSRW